MSCLTLSLTADSCITPLLEAEITLEAIRRDENNVAAQNVFFINVPLYPGFPKLLNR